MNAPAGEVLVKVAALDELIERGVKVVKVGRKQIALFHGPKGVFACSNRCPHEGYPLSEGSLADGCVLTCNWHNWKFDLASGETLVGGDRLRRYPVRIENGAVLLDVADPPPAARAAGALANLDEAFDDHDYTRLARELSRLEMAGGDPLDAARRAVVRAHDRFEFGTTHAVAVAADWLALHEARAQDPDAAVRLVPLLEAIAYLAWDALREPRRPFAAGSAAYDAAALVAAIEAEDEAGAVALVRGGLAAGLSARDLEAPLAAAALAHYADFGHSAIYVYKTGQLIDRLGPAVAEPLLLAQVRQLIYATREDLIPEFRDYRPSLEAWDERRSAAAVTLEDFAGQPLRRCLTLAAASGGDRQALFDALLGAAAWSMLHYDLAVQERTDVPVSQNVGWLDFTHAVTFANAVHALCARHPRLWPRGLLQMACFVGRNAAFVDRGLDVSRWRVANPRAFFEAELERLLDHAQPEYIIAAHQLKTLVAAREEIERAPDAPWVEILLAALNRFLRGPMKRKHVLRTARQALAFVESEG
jgi:nitrite reductase/ring-hydroxylating ferredoxin subunit